MGQQFELDDLRELAQFRKLFTKKSFLGDGGDGEVYAYEHNSSKALVAVKTPLKKHYRMQPTTVTRNFEIEIANLEILQQHDHIAGILASARTPIGPAIFLPFCELGDISSYVIKWKDQQRNQKRLIPRVSEVTIWKCIHDMTLALDYLHNMDEDRSYTHNDIKPGNILVDLPAGWKIEDGIPDEPVFKLTDFARMTRSDPTAAGPPGRFRGTPEYAPPLREQPRTRPSGDMWALAGTIQTLALGVYPIQTREAFSASRIKQGRHAPILMDDSAWLKTYWRYQLPTVYRPLCATQEELKKDFDIKECIVVPEFYPDSPWEHKPYSKSLNIWYGWMFEKDADARVTTSRLIKHCLPMIERRIRVARADENAEECIEKALRLEEEVEKEKIEQVVEIEGVAFEMLNISKTEGEGNDTVEEVGNLD